MEFVHATELLPKLGYRVRAHLMNPMMAALGGQKMSSSDGASTLLALPLLSIR